MRRLVSTLIYNFHFNPVRTSNSVDLTGIGSSLKGIELFTVNESSAIFHSVSTIKYRLYAFTQKCRQFKTCVTK